MESTSSSGYPESMLSLMFSSREEIERVDRAYRAGIDDAVAHLRSEWGLDSELDFSIDSLGAVGVWFAEKLENGLDADDTWLPAWWDPKLPPAGSFEGHCGPFTRGQLKLIDDVHAYVAEVMLRNIPGSAWVVYKGSKKDVRNGDTVLQLNKRLKTFSLSLVYGSAVGAVLLDKPVDTELFREFTKGEVLAAMGTPEK